MDSFSVLDRYTGTKKFIITITGEINGTFWQHGLVVPGQG